eukprot:1154717-Pelagomonas_calceolata.AAC.1
MQSLLHSCPVVSLNAKLAAFVPCALGDAKLIRIMPRTSEVHSLKSHELMRCSNPYFPLFTKSIW